MDIEEESERKEVASSSKGVKVIYRIFKMDGTT
jgi:hypothetical protein